jgi:single-stranded DNA-binding protein
MSEFTFTFEGNLAAKPELEVTDKGVLRSRLRVVHNRRRRNAEGEWVDTAPMFVTATAWGDLAARCAELETGTTVLVNLRNVDAYPFTRQDGTLGAVLQGIADNVSLSMRFNGALPVANPNAGDAWDPAADGEAERHLHAVA